MGNSNRLRFVKNYDCKKHGVCYVEHKLSLPSFHVGKSIFYIELTRLAYCFSGHTLHSQEFGLLFLVVYCFLQIVVLSLP